MSGIAYIDGKSLSSESSAIPTLELREGDVRIAVLVKAPRLPKRCGAQSVVT